MPFWEDDHHLALIEQSLSRPQRLTVALAAMYRERAKQPHNRPQDGDMKQLDLRHIVGDARHTERDERNIRPGNVIRSKHYRPLAWDIFHTLGMQPCNQRQEDGSYHPHESIEPGRTCAIRQGLCRWPVGDRCALWCNGGWRGRDSSSCSNGCLWSRILAYCRAGFASCGRYGF